MKHLVALATLTSTPAFAHLASSAHAHPDDGLILFGLAFVIAMLIVIKSI